MNEINKFNYLNNISDIISLSKNDKFSFLLDKIDKNIKINVKTHLIHKNNYIDHYEQFIFNLDNYISYLKNILFINSQEIRIIANLTIYNKYNNILFDNEYYYDNVNKYNKCFKDMLFFNYKKNIKFLKKYLDIKEKSFDELIFYINKHKKRTYNYFENIDDNNMSFYLPIIEYLESIN